MKRIFIFLVLAVAIFLSGTIKAQNSESASKISEKDFNGYKFIDSDFIKKLSDEKVRKALSNSAVIDLIAPKELINTSFDKPSPIPIQPMPDAIISEETISKLSDKDVQEALTIPVIQNLVFSDGTMSAYGRPAGSRHPRPRGGYIAPELLRTLSDSKVQEALQIPVIQEMIEIHAYNGRPVGMGQPRPRGGYIAPERIEELANPEVQEALKLPLIQELIFGETYDPAAYNGRPVGMGQPRPRGN